MATLVEVEQPDLDITVEGRTITVSHPDKVLFPASGITKADLAHYYQGIGPTMVPLIRDRPITLVRHPSGISGKGFFQKNTPNHYPDWIPRVELKKKGGVVLHCVVDHPAALVYFAQQECDHTSYWLGQDRRPWTTGPDGHRP